MECTIRVPCKETIWVKAAALADVTHSGLLVSYLDGVVSIEGPIVEAVIAAYALELGSR